MRPPGSQWTTLFIHQLGPPRYKALGTALEHSIRFFIIKFAHGHLLHQLDDTRIGSDEQRQTDAPGVPPHC
jgi:hypothetical protein